MNINTANLEDVPALSVLLSELFSQEAEFTPDTEAQARGLSLIIANPGIGVVLIAREGRLVRGMVNLLFTISTALGEKVALLEDMVVTSEARGAGIGSRILKHAIAVARANGCKRITLLTDKTNAAAQGFYTKHGFEISTMLPLRLSLNE